MAALHLTVTIRVRNIGFLTFFSILKLLLQDLFENIKENFDADLEMELDSFSQDEPAFVDQVGNQPKSPFC